jgi:hypothetical protein
VKLERDDNGEELQLQEEILLEHFQHIFGLQRHALSSHSDHYQVNQQRTRKSRETLHA